MQDEIADARFCYTRGESEWWRGHSDHWNSPRVHARQVSHSHLTCMRDESWVVEVTPRLTLHTRETGLPFPASHACKVSVGSPHVEQEMLSLRCQKPKWSTCGGIDPYIGSKLTLHARKTGLPFPPCMHARWVLNGGGDTQTHLACMQDRFPIPTSHAHETDLPFPASRACEVSVGSPRVEQEMLPLRCPKPKWSTCGGIDPYIGSKLTSHARKTGLAFPPHMHVRWVWVHLAWNRRCYLFDVQSPNDQHVEELTLI